LEIKRLDNGLFESNTWLIAENGFCTVVDCGAPARDIVEAASRMGARITDLVLTHGHVDHIWQAEALKSMTGARISLHQRELALYQDEKLNGYAMFGYRRSEIFPLPDHLLADGDMLETGGPVFRILHTPGHTSGCICLLTGNHLFTGDTLFRRGVGRTDLPTGQARELIRSIRETLYTLDDELVVHPGHGADTTIGEEKKANPHVPA